MTNSLIVPSLHELVLVTGPSGAGRTTAINALEDLGFEVIDNIPMKLVPRLVDGLPLGRPIALGLDTRNRDFKVETLMDLIDSLGRNARVEMELLYVDCSIDDLIRRFSETRRRHPLAPDDSPVEGIEKEIALLAPIRARADHLIDTTDMSPHDLKAELGRRFDRVRATRLAVSVQSFSYKRGVPRGVDLVFDCRFLKNPFWVPELRDLDGLDRPVVSYIESDKRFAEFYERLEGLVMMLLPAHLDEGKSHLTIAFGCTGGRHRSVVIAEKLGNRLAEMGWPVSQRHRELERRVTVKSPNGIGVINA